MINCEHNTGIKYTYEDTALFFSRMARFTLVDDAAHSFITSINTAIHYFTQKVFCANIVSEKI